MQTQKSVSSAPERRLEERRNQAGSIHPEQDNLYQLEALGAQISDLLGESKRDLLRKYTVRLFAQFNADFDWLCANETEHDLYSGG